MKSPFLVFILCFVFLTLFLGGCKFNKVNNEIHEISVEGDYTSQQLDVLTSRVNEYFSFEKEKNWNKTYEYRTSAFKQSVPIDFYAEQMEKDFEGWMLIEFDIVYIKFTQNTATVTIRFLEEGPNQLNIPILRKKKSKITIEVDTKWKMSDNNWLVLEPGTRTHISLNSQIVVEY